MSDCSKEPWNAGVRIDHILFVSDKDGNIIADTIVEINDARRIVACVNACAGISIEVLERSKVVSVYELNKKLLYASHQRDELLKAAKHIQSILRHPTQSVTILDCAKLDDAIENAESD